MTDREKEIIEIIKNNPTIEQNDIAKLLNISRSTVAVHIASLEKQGYLLGKGYILNHDNYVVGIGAANVDIYGKSTIKIKEHYDHPSLISSSVGGVTRNILDNLSRLGAKTKLLTAIGDDVYGQKILTESNIAGIDTNYILNVKNSSSGVFMQVFDEDNDMYLALCDMSVLNYLDVDYIKKNNSIISKAKAIIMDPSISIEVIEYILNEYKMPIFLDPISDEYARKIKPYISKIHTIKPNIKECEILADYPINNLEDAKKASKILVDKGIKEVYLSLGKDGCLYTSIDKSIHMKTKPIEKMVNASGAGDSFMAAIVYGYLNDLDIEYKLRLALAAGIAAIKAIGPINYDISIKMLEDIIKENDL